MKEAGSALLTALRELDNKYPGNKVCQEYRHAAEAAAAAQDYQALYDEVVSEKILGRAGYEAKRAAPEYGRSE